MLTLLCGADRLATSAALLCAVRTRAEAGKGGNIICTTIKLYFIYFFFVYKCVVFNIVYHL